MKHPNLNDENLAIAITAKRHNPTVVTPDCLNNKRLPRVLCSANFNRAIAKGGAKPIAPDEPRKKLAAIKQLINNWQTDLGTYQQVVNTKFFN